MVDGGELPHIALPDNEYLAERTSGSSQWRWLIGPRFEALRQDASVSPKFRAPPLEYVFRGFAAANRIVPEAFFPVGSLATGGLSNAWGCGVSAFSDHDLEAFPIRAVDIQASMESVVRRIGVSGRSDDDLADLFGVDAWAQAPVSLDPLHDCMLGRYARRRDELRADGFRLGRARLAVLSEAAFAGRETCTRLGLCLWGCPREALYSARHDLARLHAKTNFRHQPGFIVERLRQDGVAWRVCGADVLGRESESILTRTVVLAAGTLASTAIAMRSLSGFNRAGLLSLPMAAFALWLPRFFASGRVRAAGVAQLAFSLDGLREGGVCGFTFSTHALPVSEFVRHTTMTRRRAIVLARSLLSSIVVANCFFPGALSRNTVRLAEDGTLHVTGSTHEALPAAVRWAEQRLRTSFGKLGARLLPQSFRAGMAGADAHYAGTMPMRADPQPGETDRDQQVCGLPGVHVADGSAFPALPAKSHTLAIMALADRTGRILADKIRAMPARPS